ncbi:MAG: DUF4388 domain-containing protein [Kiritimatiellia bacterium]|jgi:hypothetical protein|nr:DUF4388 domain-containing protein [Kiritimatiellia bacterium]MDP6848158.1 DUF4388 domain-containing protein [Kiritimatiellia bacterium]
MVSREPPADMPEILAQTPPYEARQLLAFRCARAWNVMPVDYDPEGECLAVAIHEPAQEQQLRNLFAFFMQPQKLEFHLVEEHDIEAAFKIHFDGRGGMERQWSLRPVLSRSMREQLARTVRTKPEAEGETETPNAEVTSGISGSLEEVRFADIVQILSAGGRKMEISLSSTNGAGRVCLEATQVVHAELNGEAGEEAFYTLMQWDSGTFRARQVKEHANATLSAPLMSLLMEGARRVDEGIPAFG